MVLHCARRNGESAAGDRRKWPNRKRRTDGTRGCTGRRSYASFHLAPDPKPKISMPRILFCLFHPPSSSFFPLFTLFAQLQIEIPPPARIKRRTIRCNDHRFRIIPRPVFVSLRREKSSLSLVTVAILPVSADIRYSFSFFRPRRSSGRKEIEPRLAKRALCSLLSLQRTNNCVTGRFFPVYISTLFQHLSRTRRSLQWRGIKQRNKVRGSK